MTNSNLKILLITTWNLTVERQLGSNWLLRTAYVGNKGTNLMSAFQNSLELNPAIYIPGQSTVANTQSRRLLQSFANITEVSVSGNDSHYESLQVTVEKRFVRGLSVLANYSYSKTMDDFGWTNPFYRGFDYARSNDNVPHAFNFSSVWEIPAAPVSNAIARGVNGWQLSGLLTWQDGFPLTIASGIDNSLSGVGRDRADFIGTDIHAAQIGFGESHGQQVTEFFDRSLFKTNAIGTFGDAGRNILQGPRSFAANLGLFKTVKMKERFTWQLRAEFFNAFNNVNFNAPGTTVGTASFGLISSAGTARVLQFSLKLLF